MTNNNINNININISFTNCIKNYIIINKLYQFLIIIIYYDKLLL